MEGIIDQLKTVLEPHQILTRVLMKEHTSMQVGGYASVLVLPSTVQQVRNVKMVLCRAGIPHMIIGNGTNIIVKDSGYTGVIIKLADNFSKIAVKDSEISAEAGASLSAIAIAACKNSLTGLEFASGIPGTVGGATVMNAGAFGGEMKDVIIESVCMNNNAELVTLRGSEHEFGYRRSRIQKEKLCVVEVKIRLEKGEQNSIIRKMKALNGRRREKQPLNFPSAGSIFKRPDGYYAGKLIDDSGLRGFRIGGAQVSEKHCGFIINTGNATAADVIKLIEVIKERVFQTSGVLLEEEVKILGG